MKVLLIWNGPANANERSILARREVPLLSELAANGIDVSIALCGDAAGLISDLAQAGVPAHVLPSPLPPAASVLMALPFAALQLRRLIARERPELIESTDPMPAIAAGLAAFARRGCVLVYRRQHAGGRTRLHLASRLATRLSHRTIVSSEAMRRQAAADDRCDPARIEIATPGSADPAPVTPEMIRAAHLHLGVDDSSSVILVLSRLRYEKGIDVLLRAMDRLPNRDNVQLWIAGTGPEEATLRRLAEGITVPVQFLGHRRDVDVLLHAADVVVIPSRRESFGRVTLEAMARARPMVASRTGGLAEAIVDGQTGLLVPPEDESALAAAISVMLADKDAAETLGNAAGERFRSRYTIAHMAASRIRAWQRSLAAGGQPH